jgi:putative endonuclease
VSGWRVYILRCRGGSLYTGATNDLARRVALHAEGTGARYTRSRLPVRLVYDEPARDRGAALRREAAVKRLTRAEKLAVVASRGTSRRAGRR